MMLSYAWVVKTQKRIADTFSSGRLNDWELQFVQSIDTKLETYNTDARLSDQQHQKLSLILAKAECSTIPQSNKQPRSSPYELTDADFEAGTHGIHLKTSIEDGHPSDEYEKDDEREIF